MSRSAFRPGVDGAPRSPTKNWLEGFAATPTADVDERPAWVGSVNVSGDQGGVAV